MVIYSCRSSAVDPNMSLRYVCPGYVHSNTDPKQGIYICATVDHADDTAPTCQRKLDLADQSPVRGVECRKAYPGPTPAELG